MTGGEEFWQDLVRMEAAEVLALPEVAENERLLRDALGAR